MKIDISKKYKTKSGFEVKIYEIIENQQFAVLGSYKNASGNWVSLHWTIEGRFYGSSSTQSDYDLVEVKKFEITDLISRPPINEVDYFGINIIVPEIKGWLATDESGYIYFYRNKPIIDTERFQRSWLDDGMGVRYIGNIKFNGNWKDSLMEVYV